MRTRSLTRVAILPVFLISCRGSAPAAVPSPEFPSPSRASPTASSTSTTLTLHTIASILSYLFFLVGGFGLMNNSARSVNFRGLHYILVALLLLSIVTGFIRYGDLPGLGQRITFACYLAWIAVFGWAMLRATGTAASPSDT